MGSVPTSRRGARIRHLYDGPRRQDVTMTHTEWQAEQFERNRAHLLGVARRVLGSTAEAEYDVQGARLRVSRAQTEEVHNLRGWLTSVVRSIWTDIVRARVARR